MTYSPTKNIKFNLILVFLMITIVAVSVAVCVAFSLQQIIWQSIFFLVALVLCELLVKYILPVYTYVLDEESFIITKTLNKKVITVCNIDTVRIVALYTRDEFKKQERYKPKSIYNYNGNLVTNSCYVLVFEYSDCSEAVAFEPSKAMADSILALTESR